MKSCGAPRHSVSLRRTPRSVATTFLQAYFHFLHCGNVVERRGEEMAVADGKGAVVGRQGQDDGEENSGCRRKR